MPDSAKCLALTALLFAGGCQYGAYFFRPANEPMQGLEVRMDPHERRECLVVWLPGMLNVPDTYLERGFVADATRASRRCDHLLLDAHYAYYRERSLERRFREDVVRIAERRGYRELWLLGSSMGAMGAMAVARENADRVTGIVLFGPWFGDESIVRAIRDAGGLARWPGPAEEGAATRSEAVWGWMRGYATQPERMPPLYIGVGESDGMRAGAELLAEHLPPARYGTAPGGHEWDSWRVMWRRLLVHPPWDPGDGAPRIDR